jgi:mono/diheme cytochrome c family protein
MRARRVVSMFAAALVWAIVLAGRIAVALAQTPAAPPANPLPYTEEQAGRGAEVFSGVCIECHARKDFSDAEFRGKWRGRTAFDLFERMRSTMPESDPGSLPRQQYLDVVAYVVKLNGLPAGSTELADDEAALKKQILALPSLDRR